MFSSEQNIQLVRKKVNKVEELMFILIASVAIIHSNEEINFLSNNIGAELRTHRDGFVSTF